MRSINQIEAVQAGHTDALPQAVPIRAGVYMRVSTREQAEKWSLSAQRSILTAHAERMGWAVRVYDEGAASGETIQDRPEMHRLLDDVEAGRVDIVLVIEWERLSRASDLTDQARITSTCRRAGVRIATPERTYDLRLAEDDFESDLHGILSKREKRKLLERTKRGLHEAMDAGKFAGGHPPLGYRFDRQTEKVVPNPDEIPLVQRVFESPLSAWRLSRELRLEGINLHYERIRRTRSLPFYLGLRPNSRGELVQADWPAMIDQETWDRQQDRSRRVARRSAPGAKPKYLLSGIIRCANCGKAVIGAPIRPSKTTGMALHVYKCLEPRRCPARGGQLTGWLVDLLVLDALKAHAGDPEILKDRYARAMETAGSQDAAAERDALKAQVRDLEARQARLVDAVEQALLPDHIIRRRQKTLDAEMKLARSRLDHSVDAAIIPSLPDLRAILALAEGLEKADRDGQRELLERLATAVAIDPRTRTLTVVWRLGGETRYRVPLFRGGPSRRVETFMERVAESPGDFVVP